MVKIIRYYVDGSACRSKLGRFKVFFKEFWSLEDKNRYYKNVYGCVRCFLKKWIFKVVVEVSNRGSILV